MTPVAGVVSPFKEPESEEAPASNKSTKKSRRGKPKFAQAGLMLVLLLLLALFYFKGVRAVRVGDDARVATSVGLNVRVPSGWHGAKQQDAGGDRMAWGARGATDEGMFVIRSRLRQSTSVTDKRFRSEAEAGLRSTGARRWGLSTSEAAERSALRYSYRLDGLRITTWFVVEKRDQWQFSCQYRTDETARKCRSFVADARIDS